MNTTYFYLKIIIVSNSYGVKTTNEGVLFDAISFVSLKE